MVTKAQMRTALVTLSKTITDIGKAPAPVRPVSISLEGWSSLMAQVAEIRNLLKIADQAPPPEVKKPPFRFYVEISDDQLQAVAEIMDIGILRDCVSAIHPAIIDEELEEQILDIIRDRLDEDDEITRMETHEAMKILRSKGRAYTVGHLESIGIACYDEESDKELYEALLANIGDKNLHPSILDAGE